MHYYFKELPVEINLMIKKNLDNDFKEKVDRLEKIFPQLKWNSSRFLLGGSYSTMPLHMYIPRHWFVKVRARNDISNSGWVMIDMIRYGNGSLVLDLKK